MEVINKLIDISDTFNIPLNNVLPILLIIYLGDYDEKEKDERPAKLGEVEV